MIARLFSRQWIFTTLLVLLATIVMARLGFWQLDRLAQRREFNDRVYAYIDASTLALDESTLSLDLVNMEFRTVEIKGSFDFENQIVLRNKVYSNSLGYHLITPIVISGTDEVVMVNRGWIPVEYGDRAAWSEFDVSGEQVITGVIRQSENETALNVAMDLPLAEGEVRNVWTYLNLELLSPQIPNLLPIYIHEVSNQSDSDLPLANPPDIEVTEGPHLGYAIQWFLFAFAAFFGYPFYVKKQELALEAS